MKNYLRINIFLFFVGSFAFAQKQFIVIDNYTKEPIPNVSVSFLNGKGTTTNNDGIFKINRFTKDSLEITAIGYTSKRIAIPLDNKIYLASETTSLDGVVVRNLRKRVLKHRLGLKNINIVVRDFSYDEFVCTYIPFPIDLDSVNYVKVKSIIVNTTGLRSKKRKFYPFKVNLFLTNNYYSHPELKDSLLTGIKTSRKKGHSHYVKIDISDKKIMLPRTGIYVSFETLSKSEYPNENLYKAYKVFRSKNELVYAAYGAAVKTLKISPESKSYSHRLIKQKSIDGDFAYLKKEKDIIYDLSLEIEY